MKKAAAAIASRFNIETVPTFIGKGMFAKAFKSEEKVYLLSVNDNAREALVYANYNQHTPQVDNLGWLYPMGKDGTHVYIMPFYGKLSASCGSAWVQYKELRRLWHIVLNETIYNKPLSIRCIDGNQKFEELVNGSQLPQSIKEAISELVSSASNMGGAVTFEFKTGSCSVDSNGVLILRDVLFDAEAVNAFWYAKKFKA